MCIRDRGVFLGRERQHSAGGRGDKDVLPIHRPRLGVHLPARKVRQGCGVQQAFGDVYKRQLERRKAMAHLACEYGVVLAEDDPYRDLRYAGEALPAIKAFDEEGWVVYLSSFSKYVSPGMRLGAAVGNKLLIRKMTIGKQSTDCLLYTSRCV